MEFLKYLLIGIVGGFIGGFLYHAFRYGLYEAWKDCKFTIISDFSSIYDWIKNKLILKQVR